MDGREGVGRPPAIRFVTMLGFHITEPAESLVSLGLTILSSREADGTKFLLPLKDTRLGKGLAANWTSNLQQLTDETPTPDLIKCGKWRPKYCAILSV